MQATSFFDFLTNNDDTRYKFWGGMSTYNFRQYGEGDMTFVSLLNNSRSELGIPEGVYFVPGSDDIYDSFQNDITRSYTGDVIQLLRRIKVLVYNGQDDFVVNTAGISYTVDEDNQPCWPKHKILMINQVSAIKSRDDARTKEGFYDAWFERIDGVPMDPETVYGRFGDIGDSESAQLAWEAGFKHSDFGVNQKLVTFSSYPSGPAGIATYCCSVQNLSDKFGPSYALPDDVLQKAKPFSEYILLNNEKLQIQWLLELFQGDEWAMVEAGIIPDGSNKVSMYTAPEVTSPMPAPIAPVPTPMAAPAARVPAAPAMPQAPRAPQAPQIPVATPQAPSSGFSTGNVGDLSVNLKNLMNTLKNKSGQA